jgi:protein-L-isoaspartate(D-aspartate) O-methyltransferase
MTDTATVLNDAARLRNELADALLAKGSITSGHVEAAFRAVPRHLFAPPGTSLEDAYADTVIRTKFDLSGTCLSSVSAPWLQAIMIREAGIRSGMRVLEIGSGGYNAALLAEVAGPDGHVVSMDIDPDVTAQATAALDAAGYAGRVTVITGDGENGAPGHAPFDAVIVSAGAWQIPPSWTGQLAPGDGRLVVPLRMNGWTRSIAFRRQGSHLVSTSATVCGFVPVQGTGTRPSQVITLTPPGGGQVQVTFEDTATAESLFPDGVDSSGPLVTWSGVTIPHATSFADLYLWLGGSEPGFCKVATGEGARLPADPEPPGARFPAGIAAEGSLACLVTRKLASTDYEFGVHAYGPAPGTATARLISGIRAWERHRHNRYEDLSGDAFAWYPSGTTLPAPDGRPMSVFRKLTGTLVITWPPARLATRPVGQAD